jgi:plastocyanin
MMWMMIWMVLFWVVVGGGILWLIPSGKGRTEHGDAMEALRARLASGEIGVEEFEQREAALRRSKRSWNAPLVAMIAAIILIIAIPTVIMAANGWDMDMRGMHGQGQDNGSDPLVRGGSTATVRIEDFAFEPGNLQVPLGATVTWTNEDSAPHDVTVRNAQWKTRRLSENESDALTFDSAGTYDYYCSIHPSMKARITVR